MSSLLFFLELELHVPLPLCFWLSYGMLEWPISMYFVALRHRFLCSVGGFLVILFKRYLSSALVVPPPPPPLGTPAVWPCLHFLGPVRPQSLGVPRWLPLDPCEGRNIPPPAATIEPSAGCTTLPSTLACSC